MSWRGRISDHWNMMFWILVCEYYFERLELVLGNINYEEFVGMLFKEVREMLLSSSCKVENVSGLRSVWSKWEGETTLWSSLSFRIYCLLHIGLIHFALTFKGYFTREELKSCGSGLLLLKVIYRQHSTVTSQWLLPIYNFMATDVFSTFPNLHSILIRK